MTFILLSLLLHIHERELGGEVAGLVGRVEAGAAHGVPAAEVQAGQVLFVVHAHDARHHVVESREQIAVDGALRRAGVVGVGHGRADLYLLYGVAYLRAGRALEAVYEAVCHLFLYVEVVLSVGEAAEEVGEVERGEVEYGRALGRAVGQGRIEADRDLCGVLYAFHAVELGRGVERVVDEVAVIVQSQLLGGLVEAEEHGDAAPGETAGVGELELFLRDVLGVHHPAVDEVGGGVADDVFRGDLLAVRETHAGDTAVFRDDVLDLGVIPYLAALFEDGVGQGAADAVGAVLWDLRAVGDIEVHHQGVVQETELVLGRAEIGPVDV